MVYKGYNKTYDFRKCKTIRDFDNDIKNNFINMSMVNDEQNHLAKHIREFKNKPRPQDPSLKRVKEDSLNCAMALLKEREMMFKAFERGIFLKPEKLEQSNQSSSDDNYSSLK